MSLHKKLYKLNSNGKTIQTWEIHSSEDNISYWTVSGQIDGKMQTSSPTAVMAKVNRTQREQVVLEMNAKVTLQTRRKYVENIDDVGKKADDALPGYSAMLAKKWEDQKKKIKFPCAVQQKFDGMRCLATKDGFFSRGRKSIEACQHIFEELKPFFEKYPEARLDGELYSHEFKHDFEKIIKAVRKSAKHATKEDLEYQKKVTYHVYDCPRIGNLNEKDSFKSRMEVLCEINDLHVNSVQFVYYCEIKNEEELMSKHVTYISRGYEGTMVRNIDMPYEGKRSNNLLKLKNFDDDEFEIIGLNEGRGGLKGHAAAFVLKMENGTEFRAKLQGSFERLKWIWENPESVVGKMCTVVYQGLTNKEGVPRFPVAKDVRGLKDRSDWT